MNNHFFLKVKKVHPDAKIPTKAYTGDLCYDLYSVEDYIIEPNTVVKVRTGIAFNFPDGWGGIIKDRSSMASKGVFTGGGVIDNQFIGEISVIFHTVGEKSFSINKGDKIAQILPTPVVNFEIIETDVLESSERGDKGFGSSGK